MTTRAKHWLIGGGIVAGLVLLWYWYSNSSSTSSSGSSTVDLTPPTITLGAYPSQAPQGSPVATGSTAPGSTTTCPAGQTLIGGNCGTPRKGYVRSTASILSASSFSPFPVGSSPGYSAGGPLGTGIPPTVYQTGPLSGTAFSTSVLNPSNPIKIPYVVE